MHLHSFTGSGVTLVDGEETTDAFHKIPDCFYLLHVDVAL